MSEIATSPTRKDRTNLIVVLAGVIALVPTVVSAWGMLGVFLDMGLPKPLAYGTSFFLEGLLISMALLARRAIIHNRSAQTEMALTWFASLVSGMLSAAHEFVGDGGHYVTPTLMTWIAVAVRLIAPLAAALLWHRVLVADEMDAMPEVPKHERRTQHAVFQAVCDASEVDALTGKDRADAVARFRKSWRQAVESSLTHWDKEQLTTTTENWVTSLRYGDHVLLEAFRRDAQPTTVSVQQVPTGRQATPVGAAQAERALESAPTARWTGQEDTAIFTNPFADDPNPPAKNTRSTNSRGATGRMKKAPDPRPTATGRDLRIAALVVSRRGGTPKDLVTELASRGFAPPSSSTLRRALNRASEDG